MNLQWRAAKAVIKRDWISTMQRRMILGLVGSFGGIVSVIFLILINSTRQPNVIPMMVAVVGLIAMVLVPVIAAAPIVDDFISGFDDLVVCSPIASATWVVARWLSGMGVVIAMLCGSLGILLALWILATPDWGMILVAYLGWTLMGMALVAIGIWAAVLTRRLVAASVVAIGVGFGLWILAPISVLTSGSVAQVVNAVAWVNHTYGFEQGIIIGGDVMYFVILTAIFLGNARWLYNRRRSE